MPNFLKKRVILSMVFLLIVSPLVKVDATPNRNGIQPLKKDDVNSVQVNQLSGSSRTFQINDGYEEVIIRKVIDWINTARSANGVTNFESYKSPVQLTVIMQNGDVAFVEPVFNCIKNGGKTCTIVAGEVLYTQNKIKVLLKSQALYDWILVGWKYESYGAPKEELLDETLYFRYYTHLDQKYSDFMMCPRIDSIQRIVGADRRHIVQASALNYTAHHGDIPYNRIHIPLSDTPENGIKITHVSIEKGISEEETRIQCRR